MKIRPLPETDLARIAPLPEEGKRKELERFRLGRPPYSYRPLRNSFSDILNVEAGVFKLPHVPWNSLAKLISEQSRSPEEEIANLQVAEGLYLYAKSKKLTGRSHDFMSLALGVGQKIAYWHSLVLIDGDTPFVPFFDPRRSKRLTADARRFVFSVMQERIRVAYPEFVDVQLGIFQFSPVDEGPREPRLYTDEGVELIGFDDLEEMVRETYDVWREVCEERDEEMRRRAGGSRGGLI